MTGFELFKRTWTIGAVALFSVGVVGATAGVISMIVGVVIAWLGSLVGAWPYNETINPASIAAGVFFGPLFFGNLPKLMAGLAKDAAAASTR